MIGWGWVYPQEAGFRSGGVVGASIAFAIGGVMIFFIGLTYAELTAAMPQCGGEHVFSYKAMGPERFVHLYLGDYFRISVLRVSRRAPSQPSSRICGRDS